MKISELIKLHGVPVKVRLPHWRSNEWFEVIVDKRHIAGAYPGFTSDGCAMVRDDNFEDYEPYVEPKPKKKLYAWISKSPELDAYFLAFTESPTDSIYQTRAPQFDCEIDS